MSDESGLSGDKRARTRDQILGAAQLLLLEQPAAALGIRQIATKAGVVHATFYNYYPTVEALIDDVASLMQASHGVFVARVRAGVSDPAELFALTTRLTLQLVPAVPGYGRLMFDAGLPVDRFLTGMRAALLADVRDGVKRGVFKVDDPALATSMIVGSMLGLALDFHRGNLRASVIETVTAELLVSLGVSRKRAVRVATAKVDFPKPPRLPLGWLALNVADEGHTNVA